MIQLLGKFHPLLVHLPIGIFLFGILLKVYEWYKKTKIDTGVLQLLLLVSTLTSILSVTTGLLLFSGGDYEEEMVLYHRNAGIVFSIISIVLYFFNTKKWAIYLWVLGIISLIITGHLGGNLTHGEEYLSLKSDKLDKRTIVDIQEAIVFEEIIKPILEEKCISCHSAKKQKGKLRLDDKSFLLKGGKNGECINRKSPTESLLLERISLPDGEEAHMPPKGKPQLSNNEIQIIDWWIRNGADFDKKVKELKQNSNDKKILLSFQSGKEQNMAESIIPENEISEASKNALDILTKAGAVIFPITSESNYLSLTIFENNFGEKELDALRKINKNILIVNAQRINNKALFLELTKLINLRKLNLSGANLNDSDIQQLRFLKELQYLNLSNTNITEKGIVFLKENPKLKHIYLFDSKFDKKQFKTIKLQFPEAILDTGGYRISEADSLKFEN